jgi:hypothetical protein
VKVRWGSFLVHPAVFVKPFLSGPCVPNWKTLLFSTIAWPNLQKLPIVTKIGKGTFERGRSHARDKRIAASPEFSDQ